MKQDSARHEAALAFDDDNAYSALSFARIAVTLGGAIALTAGVMVAVDIVLARIS
jgi:hypothetical protein